jgi:hypothetical protein
MSLRVEINSVTGQTPYDVYICDPYGSNCVYIDRVETLPYSFDIPYSFDNFNEYRLKIIDDNGDTIFKNLTL